MPRTLLVSTREAPGITARWIGEDFPGVVVHVPEVEAIGPVLDDRLRDLLQAPLLRVALHHLVGVVDGGLVLDVEPIVVEEGHLLLRARRTLHDHDDLIAAEPGPERLVRHLDGLEAEELLEESPRALDVSALQRRVAVELELERGLD